MGTPAGMVHVGPVPLSLGLQHGGGDQVVWGGTGEDNKSVIPPNKQERLPQTMNKPGTPWEITPKNL